MNKRKVTTRKDHLCEGCGETIPKGTECYYMEGKFPTYDENDVQDGVWYYKGWKHLHDCQLPKICTEGEHEWEKEMELDHYVGCHRVGAPTGREYCKNCYRIKSDIL